MMFQTNVQINLYFFIDAYEPYKVSLLWLVSMNANADNVAWRPTHWRPFEIFLQHWVSNLVLTKETPHHECCHFRLIFCEKVVPTRSW